MSDWDEDSWGRGRGPREGRAGGDARPDRRAPERPARGASSWESERPERSGRGLVRERDAGPRASSSDWDRPGGSPRGDGQGSSRGGRRFNYDDDHGGSQGRAPRDRYDDMTDGRDNRSPRGARPPSRDDRDARDRRPAPGGPASRGGPAPRGGLWDDQEMQRRRRPDGSDPRARSAGRIDPRDPRALRRGLIDTSAQLAPRPKKGGFGIGKAILIILLMFLVGAGAAYGYFRVSTPAVRGPASSNPGATPASTTSGAGTTPSASPHSNVPAAHPYYVVL